MPFIAVLKNFLFVLLLSVISGPAVHAAEPARLYRFGEWQLVLPADASPENLQAGSYALQSPLAGTEFLAYWQDGRRRAVLLRFDGSDSAKDYAAVRSQDSSRKLRGCRLANDLRIRPLGKAVAKGTEAVALPDDVALTIADSTRGLRRVGEVLVADMGRFRVQLIEDSPVVRIGEWNSADFCRIELKLGGPDVDEEDN